MSEAEPALPEPRSPDGPGVTDDTGVDVAALRERVAELTDQRLRAVADLQNARKRHERELSQARAQERVRVTRQWLPVLDNLERALAHADADPKSIIDGVRAVDDQALELVSQLGFPRQDDLGAPFNPSRHEAAGSIADADAAAGTVIEVLQPAYGEGDQQLRPALVVVAKGD